MPALLAGLTAGFVAIGMNRLRMTTLTGVAAGAAVVVVMGAYVTVRGQRLYDPGEPTEADRAARARMSLPAAISPWLILVVAAAISNTPPLPLFDLLFKRLAMPVEIIPGVPIKIRFFWQAYFWVAVAYVINHLGEVLGEKGWILPVPERNMVYVVAHAAASGIGGGLASVISPAKLQNAAAIIDSIGEEGNVLRKTVLISVAITLLCAIMTLIWTAFNP